MFRSISSRAKLPVLAFAALGASACLDSTAPTPHGSILFVNANASASSTAALHMDGGSFLSSVGYADAAQGNVSINDTDNTHTFTVTTGTSTTVEGTQTFEVEQDSSYTLVFVQRLLGPALVKLSFDATAAASGQSKVRVANYATEEGAVDVYLTAKNADISSMSPTEASVGVEGTSNYMAYTAGLMELRITPAGSKTVLLDKDVNLAAGQVVTVLNLDPITVGGSGQSIVIGEIGF